MLNRAKASEFPKLVEERVDVLVAALFEDINLHAPPHTPGHPKIHLVDRGAKESAGGAILESKTLMIAWYGDVSYEL